MALAAGDVVQLKSGGPQMTVESVGPDVVTTKVRAFCAWFVQDGTDWKLCKNSFEADALETPAPATLAA